MIKADINESKTRKQTSYPYLAKTVAGSIVIVCTEDLAVCLAQAHGSNLTIGERFTPNNVGRPLVRFHGILTLQQE